MNRYSADRYINEKNKWVGKTLFFLLVAIILLIALYLYRDLNRSPTIVDNSKNSPISRTLGVVATQYEIHLVEELEISLPPGWKQLNNPEIFLEGTSYYPHRLQGVSSDEIGRRLDVYTDAIPPRIPVNRVMVATLSDTGEKLIAGQISEACYKFSKPGGIVPDVDHEASWLGHKFFCHPFTSSNTIVVVVNNQSDGVTLSAGGISKRFLLVYQDHGSRQDDQVLNNIVNSIELKPN